MSRLKRAATAAAILLAGACTGDAGKVLGPSEGPLTTISDAAHAGQVPGFYFLPPLVPAPAFSGTFDPALSPTVQVCELSGASCGTVIATFTTSSGLGGQVVQASPAEELYKVNWHTNLSSLDPAKTYRISVYVGTFLLGFADVDVVSSGRELKNVDTQQYIPLVDDKTLPIKFRVETGIIGQVLVSPATATINVGQTQQFTATLVDLHGDTVTGPTVAWSSSNTAVATIDQTGLATGVAPGTVTITASLGYVSGTASLTVEQPNQPPVANPDTFQAIGNFTTPVAAPGVLANDTDPDTDPLTAVPGTITTANGGTVVLAADGSFTYLSASGFTGTDSFTYQATDGIDPSAPATVTISVPTRVWYVSNAGTAPGDGRDASPFTELFGADSASADGETIFLLYGDGSTTGYSLGITLKNGQSLTGQGVPANVTASLNGQTVTLLAAGSAPTVTNSAPLATIRLASGNTVQGLNVLSTAGAGIAGSGFGTFTAAFVNVAAAGGPSLDLQNGSVAGTFATLSSSASTGAGLRLSGVSGTLTAPAGVIANAAGAGVDVSGGDADVAYGGSISGTGTRAVSVTGRTGGTLTLSGDITDASGGILAQNNTGGTIAFTGAVKTLNTGASNGVTLASNTGATISFGGGGLGITTTTGTGFSASGGGTVSVTGANNAIGSTAGTALSVQNTTIGASGLTFRSISASGGANGIVLVNTGAANGLQVTGDGATAGSGGTIQNTTGADGAAAGNGIYLSGVRNVQLSWMALSGHANNGIYGTGVNGLSVDHVRVTGTNGGSNSGALAESAVHLENSSGALVLTNSRFDGGAWNGFLLSNTSGAPTVDSLVLEFDTVATMQGSLVDVRNTALQALIHSGTAEVRMRNNHLTYWWGNAIQVSVGGGASGIARINGNVASQTSGALAGAGGIRVSGGNLQYNISGNSVQGANGAAISADKSVFGALLQGTIDGNTIGTSGVTNSGSGTGIAILATHSGTSATTTRISNNVIRQIAGSANGAITLLAGDDVGGGGSGTMNATVVGNDIRESGTPTNAAQHGILVTHGRVTGDTDQGCYDIGGAGALANTITNFNTASGATAQNRIRVNQRFNTTSRWPGYTGAATGATSATDMAAYLLGRNNASNSLNANSSTGGFLNTSPAGSPCPQPSM